MKIFISRLTILLLLPIFSHAASNNPIVFPTPSNIKNNETIWLECGQIYSGELNLEGKENVTVKTRGTCGPATITPASLLSDWKQEKTSPGIWSAALNFIPSQIEIDGKFIELAHYPNRPRIWAKGRSSLSGQLNAALPNSDIAGANLVWRAADWLIMTRTVLRSDGQIIYLADSEDTEFGLLPETDFYLEGKRWMLDTPGEWAYADGRLYVWPPDKKSPEGRIWVATRARAINASHSRNVRIENIKITGATLGIDATGSYDMVIRKIEIRNSDEEAILVGGLGMRIKNIVIIGSVKNGIRASDDARNVEIIDSQISDVGMLGMPRRSKGAIVFENSIGHRILGNTITDSSFIAIRVFRDAVVKDNQIDRACIRLTDCGGIYTYARDHQPLRVKIAGNRIRNLQGRMAHAIYLDDFANGVSVIGNYVENNPGGMQLHNGFNNQIRDNDFIDSQYEHILFNETAEAASICQNQIVNNRFRSDRNVPIFRLWSRHGSRYVDRFANFEDNIYTNSPKDFAEVAGRGMLSYSNWKKYQSALSVTGHD